MSKGCLDYQMTRRRMLGISSATLLGMPIAQMLAHAGETKKAKAEHGHSLLERWWHEPH